MKGRPAKPAKRTPDSEDAEAGVGESSPLRRCIVTGMRLPQSQLLRFVVGPGDEVVPDVANRLPGRGLWLSARRDVVETASAKGHFARAARCKVTVPSGLADRVEALLRRRTLDHLALARRAGQAVAGFEKALALIAGGEAGLLVQAADAGEHGLEKVRRAGAALPRVDLFTAAELGAVFGRDNAVHVVLRAGPLADRLQGDAARLAGMLVAGGPEAGGREEEK